MADQAHRIDQPCCNAADQLDFLAAHHVCPAIADKGNARNDGLALSYPHEVLREVVGSCRAGHVRRLLPAAVRADHSGKKQWMIAEALPDLRDGGRKAAILDG